MGGPLPPLGSLLGGRGSVTLPPGTRSSRRKGDSLPRENSERNLPQFPRTPSLLLLTIGEGERFSIWRSCGRPRKTLYRPSRPEEWEVHFLLWVLSWGAEGASPFLREREVPGGRVTLPRPPKREPRGGVDLPPVSSDPLSPSPNDRRGGVFDLAICGRPRKTLKETLKARGMEVHFLLWVLSWGPRASPFLREREVPGGRVSPLLGPLLP